jgi:uncharacterized protein (TIGR00369 family)
MQAPTLQELQQFFAREIPHADLLIEAVGVCSARVRKPVRPAHIRPGGTVSGPTIMELADAALYVAILGQIGLVALAVTTSLNFNFLRRPSAQRDLIAECTLLKLGRVLAVGEVTIYSDGEADPVAHATGTYSIPPKQPEQ